MLPAQRTNPGGLDATKHTGSGSTPAARAVFAPRRPGPDRSLNPPLRQAGGLRLSGFGLRPSAFGLSLVFLLLGTALLTIAATAFAAAPAPSPSQPESPPPTTPREFFNAGTEKQRDGKLREAEALLESALGSQITRLQPPALYNLGHVRFGQGWEELKKGPAGQPTAAAGRAVSQEAAAAIRLADAALVGGDMQTLVAAYLRGRGQRRELKTAATAVRHALQTHGAALAKWQRAAGDFRSALELRSTDTDARHNAEVVDRWIAKLKDMIRTLDLLANALSDQRRELGEKLKQIRGRLPAPNTPPGAAGEDDEEDDEQPKGPEPGQIDGPTREGQEITITPEQAAWLLEGFRLDAERRLPMSRGAEGEPRDRKRPTW